MNASQTACILSAGIMLATTIPAFAQSPGQGRGFRDRQPQRAVVQQRQFRSVARDVVVRRHAYVDRRAFAARPYYAYPYAYPYAYVAPRYYYPPPLVAYGPPLYYYVEPPYYLSQAPAPSASVPPPPPARAAKPAPAAKRFTLSADALFDFDQSVLRPEGRRQLDKLAADLKGTEYDIVKVTMVTVTGHTDRLGAASYNMRLSMRRAETVKAHLVNLGIPAAKIVATGRGETNPVTKPGQCPGEKATQELIACLQPDRRVEVEVSIAK
jgi:outer membrane protein OmpA-like peptidoglycan-associated protein